MIRLRFRSNSLLGSNGGSPSLSLVGSSFFGSSINFFFRSSFLLLFPPFDDFILKPLSDKLQTNEKRVHIIETNRRVPPAARERQERSGSFKMSFVLRLIVREEYARTPDCANKNKSREADTVSSRSEPSCSILNGGLVSMQRK